jgi:hypothetical protein
MIESRAPLHGGSIDYLNLLQVVINPEKCLRTASCLWWRSRRQEAWKALVNATQ